MTTTTTDNRVTYPKLLYFFLPLALSSMMMRISHTIISFAMARTPDAAAAIAAYSVASSISLIFESLCYQIRRMTVALVDSKETYQAIWKVAVTTLALLTTIMIAIAFTTLGKFVFIGIVGIPEDLYPQAIRAFRVFLILPAAAVLRSVYQGIIILGRKTHIMTLTVVIRLLVMGVLAVLVVNTQFVSGSLVGAVLLAAGIALEGVLAYIMGKKTIDSITFSQTHSQSSRTESLWAFYLPLVAAGLIQTLGRPSINSGLARAINPKVAIASFEVAYSFAWIFVAISFNIHQLVLVFAHDTDSFNRVMRFVIVTGLVTCGALLLAGLTPLGALVFTNIIGVSTELTKAALRTTIVLALVPLVMVLVEFFAGLLMKYRRTASITTGKVLNVLTVLASVFIISNFFPQLGGVMAGIAMLNGYLVELIIVYLKSKDILKQLMYSAPKTKILSE